MEQFLGKWVEVKGDLDNMRKFMEKMEIPKETADKMLSYTGFSEIVKDGELFKIITGYKEDPSLNKTYHFKMNETFSDTDNFGIKFTMVCKVEGNKWYDTCTEYNGQTFESVREVDGDMLVTTSTCKETTLVSKFKRE